MPVGREMGTEPIGIRSISLDVAETILPESDYTAILKPDGVLHEEVFGEVFEIPADATRFKIAVDRTNFPPVVTEPVPVLKARADFSLDGGVTWQLLCSFSTLNGPAYHQLRDGNGNVIGQGAEKFESSVDIGVPGVGSEGRLIRTCIIPLVPLRTELRCTVRAPIRTV